MFFPVSCRGDGLNGNANETDKRYCQSTSQETGLPFFDCYPPFAKVTAVGTSVATSFEIAAAKAMAIKKGYVRQRKLRNSSTAFTKATAVKNGCVDRCIYC